MMSLKENLQKIGFLLPSDKKLKIFRGRIYKMLSREQQTSCLVHDTEEEEVMQEWEAPFSPQHTFQSFMQG